MSLDSHPAASPLQSLPPLRVSERALVDLGFGEVQEVLRGLARTPFGKEALVDDVFTVDADVLARRTATAMEAKSASLRKVAPDFGGLREVRHIVDASGKGIVLGPTDILDVAKTIDALGRLKDVITFQGDEAPQLAEMAGHVADERRFARRVFRSFDESGTLTDDASPELAVRRARVRVLRQEAQEKLVDLVRELGDADLLRDRNFTVRNDRYVLPVKSEFQGKVDGIVHDASQTHQTVFIEPRALLQLGNRIKIARADVVEEEQRILQELSLEIDELAPRLASDLKVAGQLEAAFARGAFAAAIDGVVVDVDTGSAVIDLRRARHPLLQWMKAKASADGKSATPVTPNDFKLGEGRLGDRSSAHKGSGAGQQGGARCLVVSGPNAGGKTVALKTLGLLSLMARAGLPIPVDGGAHAQNRVPAWSGISVSIGDEQSLQGGFSSFSGHLVGVKAIVDDVAGDTRHGPALVLFDELMSGTDPAQGAALAQAVLEDLVKQGAVVVVTTHYDRLKALAIAGGAGGTNGESGDPPMFRNASVGVDSQGRPTFVLTLDEVGTSNAIDAARRFGIAESTVGRAVALLEPDQKELQGLLRALSEQKQSLQARVDEAETQRLTFEKETAKLEKRLVEVETERARLRREGKKAFVDELKEAREEIARAIEAARSGAAPHEKGRALNAASHALKKLDDDTHAELASHREAASSLLQPKKISAGDVVELSTMPGVRLTVVDVDDDEVVVARGAVRTRAPISNVRTPGENKREKQEKLSSSSSSAAKKKQQGPAVPAGPEPRSSDNSLDVRGQRADEAVELLEAFLDKLLREGRSTGFLLHGHGGGALKKALRAWLSQSRYVKGHGSGAHDDGGDGWTVIELNPDARL